MLRQQRREELQELERAGISPFSKGKGTIMRSPTKGTPSSSQAASTQEPVGGEDTSSRMNTEAVRPVVTEGKTDEHGKKVAAGCPAGTPVPRKARKNRVFHRLNVPKLPGNSVIVDLDGSPEMEDYDTNPPSRDESMATSTMDEEDRDSGASGRDSLADVFKIPKRRERRLSSSDADSTQAQKKPRNVSPKEGQGEKNGHGAKTCEREHEAAQRTKNRLRSK